MIFSAAITQARHDILDEEAMQITTIKKYEETISRKNQKEPTEGGGGNKLDDSTVVGGKSLSELSHNE